MLPIGSIFAFRRPVAMADPSKRYSAVLFVAGSGFDLVGTARVGPDSYWHNRAGLTPQSSSAPHSDFFSAFR